MATTFFAVDPQFLDLAPVNEQSWPASADASSSRIVIWRIATAHEPGCVCLPVEKETVVQGLVTLFPQLSPTCTGPSLEIVEACLANASTFTLFLATETVRLTENGGTSNGHSNSSSNGPSLHMTTVVGCLTLITLRLLMNSRAHIEDLIVSDSCRRQGVGHGLMKRGLQEAFDVRGCKMCDLTSKPDRVQAWALYQSMGFQLRDTGAFRLYNPKLKLGLPAAQ
ncbi:hypothetical protein BGX28_005062 [Mortierella sp. GBA30]|nr:hypothetical protein BGX28_005062 [Mortierella sp. GBA30]